MNRTHTVKQQAHELINRLPNTAIWDDVAEALAVVRDIEAGLADSNAGRVVDTAALREHFRVTE